MPWPGGKLPAYYATQGQVTVRRILMASFLLTAVLTVGSATMAAAQTYGGGGVQGAGADQGTGGTGAVAGTSASTGLARTGAAFVSPGLVGTAIVLILAGGLMLFVVNRRRATV